MGFSLFIIIGSMSSVRAQDEKRIVRSIIIMNGDTIINGQKLSEAKKEDQVRLRKDLQELGQNQNDLSEKRVIIKGNRGKEPLILNWNDDAEKHIELDVENPRKGNLRIFKFNGEDMNIDSLLNGFNFKMDELDTNLTERGITIERNFRFDKQGAENPINLGPKAPKSFILGRDTRKNLSTFSYNHTDQDGIPSRMNISISEIEKDQKEKIIGSKNENTDLEVEDLTLFPIFSSGKMGISFNTTSNTNLKLKILTSDFKQVFSDDASTVSGNYTKQFSLPKNGIYYIAIKQNNNWFLRKLIKS